jgi:hypothetical protein
MACRPLACGTRTMKSIPIVRTKNRLAGSHFRLLRVRQLRGSTCLVKLIIICGIREG